MSNLKRRMRRMSKGNLGSRGVKNTFKDGFVVAELFQDPKGKIGIMSNLKRILRRMIKGERGSPGVKSIFKDGFVVTEIFYNGHSGRAVGRLIRHSKSDLKLLDKAIMKIFEDEPCSDMDQLLDIAYVVRLCTLTTFEDFYREA